MKVSVETTYVQPTINSTDSEVMKFLKNNIITLDGEYKNKKLTEFDRGYWWGYMSLINDLKAGQILFPCSMEMKVFQLKQYIKKHPADEAAKGRLKAFERVYDWCIKHQ